MSFIEKKLSVILMAVSRIQKKWKLCADKFKIAINLNLSVNKFEFFLTIPHLVIHQMNALK